MKRTLWYVWTCMSIITAMEREKTPTERLQAALTGDLQRNSLSQIPEDRKREIIESIICGAHINEIKFDERTFFLNKNEFLCNFLKIYQPTHDGLERAVWKLIPFMNKTQKTHCLYHCCMIGLDETLALEIIIHLLSQAAQKKHPIHQDDIKKCCECAEKSQRIAIAQYLRPSGDRPIQILMNELCKEKAARSLEVIIKAMAKQPDLHEIPFPCSGYASLEEFCFSIFNQGITSKTTEEWQRVITQQQHDPDTPIASTADASDADWQTIEKPIMQSQDTIGIVTFLQFFQNIVTHCIPNYSEPETVHTLLHKVCLLAPNETIALELAKILAPDKIMVCLPDKIGKTPIDYARERQYAQLSEYLEEQTHSTLETIMQTICKVIGS